MDEADIAQKNIEFLERANRYRSIRDEVNEKPTGFCLFCAEPVPQGWRWCGPICRDDWVKENER